jgi:hypothetical protein
MDEEEISSVAHVKVICVGLDSKNLPPCMAHVNLCSLRNLHDPSRCLTRRDKASSCLSCLR